METWDISFDVAAVVITLMLMLWYAIEKRIPLRSHRVYLSLITLVFLMSSMGILGSENVREYGTTNNIHFKWIFSIQMMFTLASSLMLFWYVVMLSEMSKKKLVVLNILTGILFVLLLVVFVSNPYTKCGLYVQGNSLKTGPLGTVLLVIDFVFMVGTLHLLYRKVRDISFMRAMILTANMILIGFATYAQIRFGIVIMNFSIAIGCITLYQYLNNPSAMTDDITKVFNRKLFSIFIKNQYDISKPFDVIVVAMDDFKFINKTYGVNVGDQMLAQIASYLVSVRKSNMVFRFGSDQFCMVIRSDRGKVDEITKTIEERFKHPWYSDSSAGVMMSASICSISCPQDAPDYTTLMEVIDYSMLVAKNTKKGGISKASELNLDSLRDDKAIEKAIKLALDRDELMVYYQPIFSVEKGAYNSAEALVRINDAELGWISPEKFIPIAEKNGLIVQMGEVILEKVCKFIRDKKLSETTIEYIEVNISPVQLLQTNFFDRVQMILDKYGVQPEQINMEITETATLSGANIVNDNIGMLVEYGIKFSLDDYGSGNANIDYINNMPFSIIKLDKYIIWDSFKNEKAGITLEYTVGMLNALKLHIVAEGVETDEMRQKLEDVGCHYMQGWYYSKAICDDEFMKLIA